MLDHKIIKQILHFHWYNWTISKFCFINYDEDAMEYILWHRIAGTNKCVLEDGGDKETILGEFLQCTYYHADKSDDFGEAELPSVEGKELIFSNQEQLIINLVFKSAPLMDALVDVLNG